jgi:hypothetical protein
MKEKFVDILAWVWIVVVIISLWLWKYQEWKDIRHSEDIEMITGVPLIWRN